MKPFFIFIFTHMLVYLHQSQTHQVLHLDHIWLRPSVAIIWNCWCSSDKHSLDFAKKLFLVIVTDNTERQELSLNSIMYLAEFLKVWWIWHVCDGFHVVVTGLKKPALIMWPWFHKMPFSSVQFQTRLHDVIRHYLQALVVKVAKFI